MEDILIFHHVPKAGGTTLLNILRQKYQRREIFDEVGATKEDTMQKLLNWPESRRKKLRLILGHMPFGIHSYFPERKATYISLVRNPIERVKSLLEDIARRESHYLHESFHSLYREGGLDAVLTTDFTPELSNEITRYFIVSDNFDSSKKPNELSALAVKTIEQHFSLVGLTDDFNSFLLLLADQINLRFAYYRRGNRTIKPLLSFEGRHIETIERMNQADRLLHNEIKRQFEDRVSKIPDFNSRLCQFSKNNEYLGTIASGCRRLKYHLGI